MHHVAGESSAGAAAAGAAAAALGGGSPDEQLPQKQHEVADVRELQARVVALHRELSQATQREKAWQSIALATERELAQRRIAHKHSHLEPPAANEQDPPEDPSHALAAGENCLYIGTRVSNFRY